MEEALNKERRERGAEMLRLAKEKKEREEEQRRREKEEIDMKVQMDQLEKLKKTAVGAKVFADVTAEVSVPSSDNDNLTHRVALLLFTVFTPSCHPILDVVWLTCLLLLHWLKGSQGFEDGGDLE